MTRNGALWVLALSGMLGFWIGIACFPTWQVAVESAQVIAGLVSYPPDNPFYIYHLKLWTVLHEILAVLLRAGLSEITLSEIVSGALGMVSLQALSIFVFAFSRDVVYAVGAAFVIFLSGAAEFGGTYPIDLMGTSHTYGTLGLSAVVLAASLLGAGCHRLGGLLLGAMPAIHPSLGIWCGLITAISVASDFKRLTTQLREALPWFVAGCGLTAASLAVHLAIARGLPPVPTEVAGRYLTSFVAFWDSHRRAPDLNNLGVYLNNPAVRLTIGLVPIALVWVLVLADYLPRAAHFLLRFILVTACLAISLILVSLMTRGWLPGFVQILMPMRILNIVGMTFAALLFGLVAACIPTPWGQLAGLMLSIALLLADRSRLAIGNAFLRPLTEGLSSLSVVTVTAIVVTLWAYLRKSNVAGSEGEYHRPGTMTVTVATLRIASVAALIVYWVPSAKVTEPRPLLFRDRTHDPVFVAAAAGKGLLLTGDGLHLIQLRTRRPVLLDGGGLDGLVYSLEAAPAMDRILRDVYGVDLLNPSSREGMWTATIPPVTNQRNWEKYSRQRWLEIRHTYNVTQVLTPPDWRLDLPTAVRTQDLRLYQIPN
jgi:hypothetical protein